MAIRFVSSADAVTEHSDGLRAHAYERWAWVTARVVTCPYDPKTIEAWGRFIAVSPGALRTWCRAAHMRPKASLELARLLRVTVHGSRDGQFAYEILDTVDERTIRAMLARSGLGESALEHPPATVVDLLKRQRVVTNPAAMRALLAALGALEIQGEETSPCSEPRVAHDSGIRRVDRTRPRR